MMHRPALALAVCATPALADWSCRIDDFCIAGDICRTPPEPVAIAVRQTSEAWVMLAPGEPPALLRKVSQDGGLPFLAVTEDAQVPDAPAPSLAAVVIEAGGAMHATIIDLAPGTAVAGVLRGTCTKE